jgi:uncharacterized protein
MHLAGEMFDKIMESNKKSKNIMNIKEEFIPRFKAIIRIAGLLHDIGHGPYSHASEEVFPIKDERGHYSHEDYSSAIIQGPMLAIFDSKNNINGHNIQAKEVMGLLTSTGEHLDLLTFKDVISSNLDADRCDYLLRDSHHAGVMYGLYDYHRLLNSLAVGTNPEGEEVVIGVGSGGWHVCEAIMLARYEMFSQVYYHKTRRAFDYHLTGALKEILNQEDLDSFPPPSKIQEYLKYDDYFMQNRIRESEEKNCRAITFRKHIRSIFVSKDVPDKRDEQRITKIKEELAGHHIWFKSDVATKEWYKKKGGDIWIIDDKGKASPLPDHSTIVNNLQEFRKEIIYTEYNDKQRAKDIINKL